MNFIFALLIVIAPKLTTMNDTKVLQFTDYIENYEKNVVFDEELTNWKSRETPNVPGLIFKDTTGTNARFLVSLPGIPVFLFSSPSVCKHHLSTVRQKPRKRKSSYYGLVETEEKFFASLENIDIQLANRLDISPNLLDYSRESISRLSSGLEKLPADHDFFDGDDPTLFLIIKYVGSTIYKLRGESWSFRKQLAGSDVKIPDTVIVGIKAQDYDWFAALTSMTVEKRFKQYEYVVEAATNI